MSQLTLTGESLDWAQELYLKKYPATVKQIAYWKPRIQKLNHEISIKLESMLKLGGGATK